MAPRPFILDLEFDHDLMDALADGTDEVARPIERLTPEEMLACEKMSDEELQAFLKRKSRH